MAERFTHVREEHTDGWRISPLATPIGDYVRYSDYAALERQIAELRDHCNAMEVEHRQAIEEMQSALADKTQLSEALAFYADISKYPAPFTGGMGALWSDCGQIARAALSGSGAGGWQTMDSAPIGTFLAINAGEIERWDHHDDPSPITRKSENRAFTCHRLEDGTFVDEFGEVYLSDGRVVDAKDLTADDNVLRLVGWLPLPAAPTGEAK